MTEHTNPDFQEMRERNARIQSMLGIGLNEFRRVKSNIALCNRIEEANNVEDLKQTLNSIVSKLYPCTDAELKVFREEFEL